MNPESQHIVPDASLELERPFLIAAFKGWNDAGESASYSVDHLSRVWNGTRVAHIDPEHFFDFQDVRPSVKLVDGHTRSIEWPHNDFYAAKMRGGHHDVLLLSGTEPNLKWRTFSRLIVDIAKAHGVEMVITLGALLADVPHTRPVHITGTAGDEELIRRLGLERSRYEGPTGIVGVLHSACAEAGLDSASLWAAVPHYLAVSPNPKAALALVHKATELTGIPAEIDRLQAATDEYERRVSEVVEDDDDVTAYIKMLEERMDRDSLEDLIRSDVPSGEAIAEELERYLRNRPQED